MEPLHSPSRQTEIKMGSYLLAGLAKAVLLNLCKLKGPLLSVKALLLAFISFLTEGKITEPFWCKELSKITTGQNGFETLDCKWKSLMLI